MAATDFETEAQAIAGRFASGLVTPPAGYANIRYSTANAPGAIGPTPAVIVSVSEGDFDHTSGGGLRQGRRSWWVRFYFDQTSDLERTEPALRKWLSVLVYQLRGAVQLGGIVDEAHIVNWKVGVLAYGGVDYTGIELAVHTATSEGWAAVS